MRDANDSADVMYDSHGWDMDALPGKLRVAGTLGEGMVMLNLPGKYALPLAREIEAGRAARQMNADSEVRLADAADKLVRVEAFALRAKRNLDQMLLLLVAVGVIGVLPLLLQIAGLK